MGVFRVWRSDLIWIAVVAVPYFLVIANYAQWWGEWCPPGRYMASILPLLALPFCIALDRIKGITYRVIYGVLLALSFLTMVGFLFQPQWMYNQPNGKSELFAHGFQTLGTFLHLPWVNTIDLTGFFPSFVTPYFGYLQGTAPGNLAVAAAWRNSLWSALIIIVIVAFCLFLAWRSPRNDPSEPPSPAPVDAEAALPNIELPTRPVRTAQPPALPPATAMDCPSESAKARSSLRSAC